MLEASEKIEKCRFCNETPVLMKAFLLEKTTMNAAQQVIAKKQNLKLFAVCKNHVKHLEDTMKIIREVEK